ncbi:THUMP-like domain-containing protein [Ekhidna sp.]
MDDSFDFIIREDVKDFIQQNINVDTKKLILNPPKDFKNQIKGISNQILARQKARGKLDNWAKNFDLIMPPPLSIEQASSLTTSQYKQPLISGDRLIDLTGGMGIDCLALSTQFRQTTYVEEQSKLCEIFQHNSRVLWSNIDIINKSAEEYLSTLDSEPENTVIYLDPARRDNQKNRVFKIEDCSPNLIQLIPTLKGKSSRVLIKLSPVLDIQAIDKAIPETSEIHIVSVKNDCKEILLIINFNEQIDTKIITVNLESGQSAYSFFRSEEAKIHSEFNTCLKYLYEPNSSIMKSGAFKKIGADFGLAKIAPNTHLYTSDEKLFDFPGKVFEILTHAKKKEISHYADNEKINVITRNYSLNANELKKKWKLKDGGNNFLIAFRDKEEKAQMVIVRKMNP